MKQILKILLAIIIPLLLCGVIGWSPIFVNNLRLKHFAENLYQYPLPPETTVLSRHAELSKLGNGNNCLYKVQQAMSSLLSREEIERYYDGAEFPRISFGQWNQVYDRPNRIGVHLDFDELQSNEVETYFNLTLLETGSHTTLDIRCH
jgi:hypothetical protein